MWLLRIQVGTQKISPLSWAIESGSLEAAKMMIEDLFVIRADREKYYYGNDALFTTHPDIIERLCADAIQLLPTLFDGLIWRSKRSVNGARRVNFYIKWLVVSQEGNLAGALKALAAAHDVKIISHPVIVLVLDTLWSGVVRRQFIVSKLGFLFSLAVFMLVQAVLPKTGSDDAGIRWAIFIGRLVNYCFSLPRLVRFHISRSRRAYSGGYTMKVGRLTLPSYLKDSDAKIGIMLAVLLAGMCATEPMFSCADMLSEHGPQEDCEAAESKLSVYTLLSMVAMVLQWLSLIDLAVFSTKLAAFVLVCKHVLNEVGKFLVAMIFILVMFSCAIASLRHDTLEFSTALKTANCLFAVTVGLYEGDYRELTHQPALLTPVLLFVTVSVILLLNLLIAQLNCSYEYVYADMLGFARLDLTGVIVDTMTSCPPNRWKRFVAGLRFEQLLEFDEGDIGLPGGIQIREPASVNPTSHDIIQRFGGSSSPEMQWPQDDDLESDRYSRIHDLIAEIKKEIAKGKKHEVGDSSALSQEDSERSGSKRRPPRQNSEEDSTVSAGGSVVFAS
eukprot:TRINITY_DN1775_c0_g8_i1.p1 TRINITY_DN1775_c0_g8~~TRINITY_DN1775_c0_g8_i1.p1  ORF type:complete len:622 (-),score=93.81 TRINITY_DN1775_c0_g8_i1:331-2007(-)